ncbi:Hypothetical_protein [Hexamita inflata]|uniref:Hypothetical_protein n=1 Tax=Hexamita inflata TaxID=28002 RepID=A0AA86PL08_9EUKA|nr:Hypothetical protein HINF_LOCUS28063 [Hexamita inflata]
MNAFANKLQIRSPKSETRLRYTSILIFQHCYSEQPPQTTQVSSTIELTLLTSQIIFVTIFEMAGMNLGTSVSAATSSASKFRANNHKYISYINTQANYDGILIFEFCNTGFIYIGGPKIIGKPGCMMFLCLNV